MNENQNPPMNRNCDRKIVLFDQKDGQKLTLIYWHSSDTD